MSETALDGDLLRGIKEIARYTNELLQSSTMEN